MECLYCGKTLIGFTRRQYCNNTHKELGRERDAELLVQRLKDSFDLGSTPKAPAPLLEKATTIEPSESPAEPERPVELERRFEQSPAEEPVTAEDAAEGPASAVFVALCGLEAGIRDHSRTEAGPLPFYSPPADTPASSLELLPAIGRASPRLRNPNFQSLFGAQISSDDNSKSATSRDRSRATGKKVPIRPRRFDFPPYRVDARTSQSFAPLQEPLAARRLGASDPVYEMRLLAFHARHGGQQFPPARNREMLPVRLARPVQQPGPSIPTLRPVGLDRTRGWTPRSSFRTLAVGQVLPFEAGSACLLESNASRRLLPLQLVSRPALLAARAWLVRQQSFARMQEAMAASRLGASDPVYEMRLLVFHGRHAGQQFPPARDREILAVRLARPVQQPSASIPTLRPVGLDRTGGWTLQSSFRTLAAGQVLPFEASSGPSLERLVSRPALLAGSRPAVSDRVYEMRLLASHGRHAGQQFQILPVPMARPAQQPGASIPTLWPVALDRTGGWKPQSNFRTLAVGHILPFEAGSAPSMESNASRRLVPLQLVSRPALLEAMERSAGPKSLSQPLSACGFRGMDPESAPQPAAMHAVATAISSKLAIPALSNCSFQTLASVRSGVAIERTATLPSTDSPRNKIRGKVRLARPTKLKLSDLKTHAGTIDAFVKPEYRPSYLLSVSAASCQLLPMALQRRTTPTKPVIVPHPKIIQANVPCFAIIQLETILRIDPSSTPFVVSRREVAELPEVAFRAISDGQLARTRATAETRPFSERPAKRWMIQQVRLRTQALQAGQAYKFSILPLASKREQTQSPAHAASQPAVNQPMPVRRRPAGPLYVRMRRRSVTPVRYASTPTPLDVIAILQPESPAILAGRAVPALANFGFRTMTAGTPSENFAISQDRCLGGDNPAPYSVATARFRPSSLARRFPAWAPGWRLRDNRTNVLSAAPTLVRKPAWARPTMKPATSLSGRQADGAAVQMHSVPAKAAGTGQTRTATMPAEGRRLRWVTEKMPWAP
jgi:hypothetical protein